MSERKALLILHGKQAQNEEVRAAVLALRERGWHLAVRLTWEGGDAARLVQEALAAGYPTLIAGGGDGTLREVAEALALAGGQAIRMGLEPFYAPFESKQADGKLVGFDIDIGNAICAQFQQVCFFSKSYSCFLP